MIEFREILGQPVNGRLYHQMEQACDRLQSRVLELRTSPTTRKKFNWMQEVKYLDAEGRIVLQFHQNLQPLRQQRPPPRHCRPWPCWPPAPVQRSPAPPLRCRCQRRSSCGLT